MRYRCEIADTVPGAYTIPIRSFQLRFRQSPRQCYVSVVVPSGLTYGDEIVSRKAGTVALYEVADDNSETELLTANIDSISVDEGAVNRSIAIVGYKQVTWPGTGDHSMPYVSYAATDRVRGLPVRDLRPQDTVTANGETFTAEEVVWTVNSTGRMMEVSGYVPALLKINLRASASLGISVAANLRPSSLLLSADGLISTDFTAPVTRPLKADAAIDLSATGRITMQSLLQAEASISTGGYANMAAGGWVAGLAGMNPIAWWRLTENSTTTFANSGSLGSSYDATLEIKSGQSGRETYRDPQHAACVPSLPGDAGLWMQYYWHLVVPGSFPSIDSDFGNGIVAGDYTIGFWFIPETVYESYARAYGRMSPLALQGTARNNEAHHSWWPSDSLRTTGGAASLDDGNPHFYLMTRYLGVHYLFVDNVLLTSNNSGSQGGAADDQGTEPLYLMGQSASDYGYVGTMQDFFILDYGLNPSQRTTLYNLGAGT